MPLRSICLLPVLFCLPQSQRCRGESFGSDFFLVASRFALCASARISSGVCAVSSAHSYISIAACVAFLSPLSWLYPINRSDPLMATATSMSPERWCDFMFAFAWVFA